MTAEKKISQPAFEALVGASQWQVSMPSTLHDLIVGKVARWKPNLFGATKQHLTLPRLVPEEFELLEAAELEPKCLG